MALRHLAWMLAALAVTSTAAEAGAIVGRLRLSGQRQSANALALGTDQRTSLADAVIVLERMPERLERRLARRTGPIRPLALMVQTGHRFVPHVLAILQGTEVRFHNQDLVYHNTFSRAPIAPFDLGKYPPRARRRVVFDHAGVVPLFCELHPTMNAYVIVVPHRGFTQADRSGRFTIRRLPAGEYTLRVWHPVRGEKRVAVELPIRGDAKVELSL
jgi:hypothetical protein